MIHAAAGSRVVELQLPDIRLPAGSVAAFDFDNTIVRHDTGERFFGVLAASGVLDAAARRLGMSDGGELVQRYKAALKVAAESSSDNKRDGITERVYRELVTFMSGLSPDEIVKASGQSLLSSGVDSISFPAPVVRPEFIKLIQSLQHQEATPIIVSASELWALRCAVHYLVNPALERVGAAPFPVSNVFGVALEEEGVRDPYSGTWEELMDPQNLRARTLGARIVEPAPCYKGKAKLIQARFSGRHLGLACGDSAGDLAMAELFDNVIYLPKAGNQHLMTRLVSFTHRLGTQKDIRIIPVQSEFA